MQAYALVFPGLRMYPGQVDVQTLGSLVVGVKFYPTTTTNDYGEPEETAHACVEQCLR